MPKIVNHHKAPKKNPGWIYGLDVEKNMEKMDLATIKLETQASGRLHQTFTTSKKLKVGHSFLEHELGHNVRPRLPLWTSTIHSIPWKTWCSKSNGPAFVEVDKAIIRTLPPKKHGWIGWTSIEQKIQFCVGFCFPNKCCVYLSILLYMLLLEAFLQALGAHLHHAAWKRSGTSSQSLVQTLRMRIWGKKTLQPGSCDKIRISSSHHQKRWIGTAEIIAFRGSWHRSLGSRLGKVGGDTMMSRRLGGTTLNQKSNVPVDLVDNIWFGWYM